MMQPCLERHLSGTKSMAYALARHVLESALHNSNFELPVRELEMFRIRFRCPIVTMSLLDEAILAVKIILSKMTASCVMHSTAGQASRPTFIRLVVSSRRDCASLYGISSLYAISPSANNFEGTYIST